MPTNNEEPWDSMAGTEQYTSIFKTKSGSTGSGLSDSCVSVRVRERMERDTSTNYYICLMWHLLTRWLCQWRQCPYNSCPPLPLWRCPSPGFPCGRGKTLPAFGRNLAKLHRSKKNQSRLCATAIKMWDLPNFPLIFSKSLHCKGMRISATKNWQMKSTISDSDHTHTHTYAQRNHTRDSNSWGTRNELPTEVGKKRTEYLNLQQWWEKFGIIIKKYGSTS